MALQENDRSRGWDNLVGVVVPVAGLVAAIATIVITYQVARLSDLGSDIKNVNNRVDQLFPLISQSTADIGTIKGSLESTVQKIATAAERNEDTSKRLDKLVSDQEGQSKNIQELTISVASLVSTIKGEQQQLDDIKSEIKSKINYVPMIGDTNPFHDATLFVPVELYKEGIGAKVPGASIVPIDWKDKDAALYFLKSLGASTVDFDKVIFTTRDAGVANDLRDAFTKGGVEGATLVRPPCY
jgi:hypothetical protein